VFKGYKIHQEQIENVKRTLKEFCQTRQPEPSPAGRTGMLKPVLEKGIINRVRRSRVRNTVWETGLEKGPVTDMPADMSPGTEAQGHTATVIRCFRCGDGFPVSDFQYTKKTGLCISCWEIELV
jgi:hypothetical protein